MLLEKKGRKYYFDGQKYKCKELTPVYERHLPALSTYLNGRKDKHKSKVMAWTGLAGLVGGFAITVGGVASAFGSSNDSGFQIVFGLVTMGAGLGLEIASIVYSVRGRSKLKKARREFNIEMIERHGYESDLSLSLETTQNGIGLVMRF